jgi:hypothetical protein
MIGCGSFRFDNFTYRLLKADFSINHTIWLTNLYCLRAQEGFQAAVFHQVTEIAQFVVIHA